MLSPYSETVEDGIAWAAKAWDDVKAAYDQPAETITKDQLLAQLARIKETSARIQGIA